MVNSPVQSSPVSHSLTHSLTRRQSVSQICFFFFVGSLVVLFLWLFTLLRCCADNIMCFSAYIVVYSCLSLSSSSAWHSVAAEFNGRTNNVFRMIIHLIFFRVYFVLLNIIMNVRKRISTKTKWPTCHTTTFRLLLLFVFYFYLFGTNTMHSAPHTLHSHREQSKIRFFGQSKIRINIKQN